VQKSSKSLRPVLTAEGRRTALHRRQLDSTKQVELRFRAVLTDNATEQVQMTERPGREI